MEGSINTTELIPGGLKRSRVAPLRFVDEFSVFDTEHYLEDGFKKVKLCEVMDVMNANEVDFSDDEDDDCFVVEETPDYDPTEDDAFVETSESSESESSSDEESEDDFCDDDDIGDSELASLVSNATSFLSMCGEPRVTHLDDSPLAQLRRQSIDVEDSEDSDDEDLITALEMDEMAEMGSFVVESSDDSDLESDVSDQCHDLNKEDSYDEGFGFALVE